MGKNKKNKLKIEQNNNAIYENKFYWFYTLGFFLILCLPLVNLPPWFSPPDWGKTIIFRIILSSMIFIFLAQILSKKINIINTNNKNLLNNLFNKNSKVFLSFWLLIAVLGINFLALIFSQDPHFSFWGSPYRSGGFLNFAFYIIFAVLAFFLIKAKHWQKIWDFSIIIGIFVSFIAIFQKYGLFDTALIEYAGRPPSTIGGPIFLAIYLMLLCFLSIGFLIKSLSVPDTNRLNKIIKGIFYGFTIILFLFVAIFVTQTRAIMAGFFIGFAYFLIFYPFAQKSGVFGVRPRTLLSRLFFNKKTILLKILGGIILICASFSIYYVNTVEMKNMPEFVQENRYLKTTAQRLSIERALNNPRISGWIVSWETMKHKPIFGYGHDNFAVGFDQFYDPSLSGITQIFGSGTGWWDRAHNVIFDIGVTTGIPSLIIYILLFAVLFYELQKLKKRNPDKAMIYHSIQALFLAYFTANFFSFDTFSTYLISFLIIAYALYLISEFDDTNENCIRNIQRTVHVRHAHLCACRTCTVPICILTGLIFITTIHFIWVYNVKPFQINTDINAAIYQSKNNQCEQALARIEGISNTDTYLNNYLGLKYIKIIGDCIKKQDSETAYILSKKASEILKKNIETQPTYTRNWLLLGIYTNYLIEKETDAEKQQELKEQANLYFEKANNLNPNRQEILIEWIKTDLMREKFEDAKQKAEKCIQIEPKYKDCYYMMGLTNIYLNEQKSADKYIEIAVKKHYNINSEISLIQRLKAYIYIKDYNKLIPIYEKLIKIHPQNPQHYASLATCYKELNDFENAKKYALKTLELAPETKNYVDAFIESLK